MGFQTDIQILRFAQDDGESFAQDDAWRLLRRALRALLAMTFCALLVCSKAWAGDPVKTIEEAKAFVESILKGSTDESLYFDAIHQLKERGGEGAELLLIELAKEQTGDEKVRASAVEALGGFSSKRVIEAVKGFEKDPSPFVQLACRKALWVHSKGEDIYTGALFEENRMSKNREVIKEILWQLKNFPPDFEGREIVEGAWWDKISDPEETSDPFFFLQAIDVLFEMENPLERIDLLELEKVISRLNQIKSEIGKRFLKIMMDFNLDPKLPESFSQFFGMKTGTTFDHVLWKRRFKEEFERLDPSFVKEAIGEKKKEEPQKGVNQLTVEKLKNIILGNKDGKTSIEEAENALKSLKEVYHWSAIEALINIAQNPEIKENIRIQARDILNHLAEEKPTEGLDAFTALTHPDPEIRQRAFKNIVESSPHKTEVVRIISFIAISEQDRKIKEKAIEYLTEPFLNLGKRYVLALPSGPDQFSALLLLLTSENLPQYWKEKILKALNHSILNDQSEESVFEIWKKIFFRSDTPLSFRQSILDVLNLIKDEKVQMMELSEIEEHLKKESKQGEDK